MKSGAGTPGEFSDGTCHSGDIFYYPIRLQGDLLDTYGHFALAKVNDLGSGILVSILDDYTTGYIDKPYE